MPVFGNEQNGLPVCHSNRLRLAPRFRRTLIMRPTVRILNRKWCFSNSFENNSVGQAFKIRLAFHLSRRAPPKISAQSWHHRLFVSEIARCCDVMQISALPEFPVSR
jgi:hypothetical protein